MGRVLRRVESIVPRRAREYGGKARNLAALARAGFPVPAAFAIPGSACEEFLEEVLPEEDRLRALVQDPEVSSERLSSIRQRVRSAPLHGRLRVELGWAFSELSSAGAPALAVRSSSTREDQDAAAAAGLHDTFLNVRDEEALVESVRACWASLFQPRVLAYLRTIADAPDATMGVVVQAMVPAEVSGVLFTINPLTGDTGEMVVNASYGLGSAIVDGRVSPDTYRIDKTSEALRDRVVGDKALRVVAAPAGGVVDEEVPAAERALPAIDDSTLGELIALGLRIEKQFDAPQDVEWAIVGGTIYVLQSRPVTAAIVGAHGRRTRRRQADRSNLVWSNLNVGEALPGVATPLTWSILSAFSDLGFRRAFGALGCTVPRDAELVGNFRGRIYLNMTEFMGIASQVPGLRPRTILALGGGGEVDRLEESVERRSSAGFFARLPLTASRFVRENYRITVRVEQFEADFEDERQRYRAMDLRVLSPLALAKTLRDVEKLLDDSGAIMLTCYGNLLASMVALRTVLKTVSRDQHPQLERGLLTGLADVESAAPGLSLWHIAEMARFDEPAREHILAAEPAELSVETLPEGPTRRALDKFLTAHGYRGPREAEIATPRWREDPSLLFATLRAHLRNGTGERPVDAERRQRELRERASRELDRMLPAPARAAVRHLLSLVQRFMRLRERLRSYVTEVLGMFRDVALDASRRIELREPGIGSDAAFFLTVDELRGVLSGELRNVSALIRQRRRQYERDVALPDPPDTFVGYPPQAEAPAPDTDALTGLGASSGRYVGSARVLMSPSQAGDLRSGEVLIAPYADVGWSPLFTVAGAVVTDLGGPLSHASIVAREYGVPSVVNVKMGTRIISTGDRVEVDGDAGTVRILDGAAEKHGAA